MTNSEVPESLEGIAIIGMAGRFPGAKNIDEFWGNLRAGVESISFFSAEELEASGTDPADLSDPHYVRARGALEDVELFDASFFGFSAREAEITDPQHRLFLECAWEAVESAGYSPENFAGSIGVYAGAGGISTYFLNNLYPNRQLLDTAGDNQILIANDKDFLSTRVSYKLNLKGPSLTVQTACSTSLVAVTQACQSLLDYQCDMALAGGVSISVPQKTGYLYREGMILSPDGHCRAFDAKAQGTVPASGAGVVVLKRLEDAVADGDCIHAVIKGFAINNDGSFKAGYTAPSVGGQAEAIAQALALAEIDPETVTYIEAHGTGTPLGDPIEIAALTQAFRASTQKKGFCAIGSVKTNIGHLDTAAGVTGLIKTVLALNHKLLPPSLHFEAPNPKIDFANSPFYVNTALQTWKTNGSPRRAGVSSFGIGGTNAHVVLEEAPALEPSGESRPWHLLVLSAKSESALNTATANLAEHLKQHPELNLTDVAYTLNIGRKAFSHRHFAVCQDIQDAVNALTDPESQRVFTNSGESKTAPVAFMFSGQGSQYVNMARDLYEVESTFREQVDLCCEFLKTHLGLDLRDLLYPSEGNVGAASERLKQTALAQPALFVIEYALAQLWVSWGVRPVAAIGHSTGEYVAACLAGVFSLEDALTLVAARGKMMQEMPPGAMLAVPLSEQEVRLLLQRQTGSPLQLAAINGPSNCVVSGPADAADAWQQTLLEQGVECRRLHTSHAFHSQMMEAIVAPFTERVRQVSLNAPKIPYISNVTGTWVTAAQATDPNYWGQHLRQTVLFSSGLQLLLKEPDWILLEIGPGRTLATLAKQQADKAAGRIALSSLRHPQDRQPDVAFLLNTLGRLWLAGVPVDWSGFYAGEQRHRLPLPTYPFERQRYWIEPEKQPDAVNTRQVSVSKKPDLADWFYVPSWKRCDLQAGVRTKVLSANSWLVFVDECGLGDKIVKRLEQENQDVIAVRVGPAFAKLSERAYTLNPQQRDDWDALLKELVAKDKIPKTVAHFWSVAPASRTESGINNLDKSQALGFYSLLFLAQALGRHDITDEIQIAVVSSNMQEVTGEEVLCPEKATLLGTCKVIPQEYPNITCRSIDIVLPESGTWQEQKLADALLAELTAKASDLVIAYRGLHRWLQTFEPVRLDETVEGAPRLREGGVYLITGGLGGIGLVLAEYLAQTVRAKLVLLGRSQFPAKEQWEEWLDTHDLADDTSRKIQKLRALEKLGAEVLTVSADVANLEEMEAAVALAEERFGCISGVIHAAGITGAKSFRAVKETGQAECDRHFIPKVRGALVLQKVLRDRKLDFCLLMSSLSSVLGGLGFVAYSAANLFMDAFADQQNQINSVPWISVNWDGWQLGEEKKPSTPAGASLAELAIAPAEGVSVFQRILAWGRAGRVAVSTGDLQARIDQWVKLESLRLAENSKQEELPSRHSRPNLPNACVAPRNELERKIADIWEKFLRIEPVGIHDDFFDLGGDSLLAVHLIAKLRESFKIELSAHSLLNAPTIAGLAEVMGETSSSPEIPRRLALPSSLVEIQKGSWKQPLFLVHPAGGHVYIYRDLVRCLGADQPVYGFQPKGLDGETQPLTQVEEMAAHYLEALRTFQPEGPYCLGGHSFGGAVAFEMAQRLQALGQKVALLVLIDAPGPGHMPVDEWEDDDVRVIASLLNIGANLSIEEDSLRQLDTEAQLSYFLEWGKKTLIIPPDFDLADVLRHHTFTRINLKAIRNYIPETYSGRVIFFRALQRDAVTPLNPELAWIDLVKGGLNIHEVPGNHITMNFSPNVQVLADRLRAYLDEARAVHGVL